MSKLLNMIFASATKSNRHVVLPEGEEPRIAQAAAIILQKKLARITLLGNKSKILEAANGLDLSGANLVDPTSAPELEPYANLLFELRKDKGLTLDKARELAKSPLYFGCLMIKSGDADGMVGGAINSTGDVLRPALQIIKTKKGIKTVSSCFLMVMPNDTYGEDGVLIFGDCAVLPNPTAEQLADIAIASADSAKSIAKIENPRVAMLSFSTMGSAKHELVDKVKTATELVKATNPSFDVDGELQLDAAIVESVGKLKAPNSKVAGKANVLIFPDLQSGNIGYKLVQRLAGAEAIGPICQGLAAPVNDLSRGCSIEDVVNVVAITACSCNKE